MKFYSILEGSTQDVLRRFLRLIRKSNDKIGTLETDVGSLKTAVGGNNSGLVKDVSGLKTTVGGVDSGLVKGVADINTAIGDPTSPAEGTILARIAALEAEAGGGTSESTPSTEPGEGG